MKERNTNVNVGQDSWRIRLIVRGPGESKLVGVVGNSNKKFSLIITGAWDRINGQLRRFLNKDDVK